MKIYIAATIIAINPAPNLKGDGGPVSGQMFFGQMKRKDGSRIVEDEMGGHLENTP